MNNDPVTQLVIADEGLRSTLGHFYEYDRAVKALAESSTDVEVVVLGHVRMERDIQSELNALPVFRYTNWDGIYDHPDLLRRYLGVFRHNFRMLADLGSYVRSTAKIDLMFAPAVVLHHLLGFYLFTLRYYKRCDQVVLMLRNSIAVYDETLIPKFRGTAVFWKVMLWLYRPLVAAGKVRFVTDSDQLATELRLLSGIDATVIPHPSLVARKEDSVARETKAADSLRVYLPGPARYEKGADLLLEAVSQLREARSPFKVTFVLQWENDFEKPDGTMCSLESAETEASLQRFEIIRTPLSSDEYQQELCAADLIVLPYRPAAYFARISGVAVEALLLGKPVVFTRDTWVARLMDQFETGVSCDAEVSSFVDSLTVALENLEDLTHRAEAQKKSAAAAFSTEKFLDGLLSPTKNVDLIYYLPVGEGGLTHYAAHQLRAMVESDWNIVVLGYAPLKNQLDLLGVKIQFVELAQRGARGQRILRGLEWVRSTIFDALTLRRYIRRLNPDYVLFGAFSEYWAPAWSWILTGVSRKVPFGVITHDPERDFVLGPSWWHNYSINCAYALMRDVFVHSLHIHPEGTETLPTLLPHGIYRYPPSSQSRESVRQDLGIPVDAWVVLSFGHVRDGKNLDLIIAALDQHKDVHLLVVGREQSTHDKSIEAYQRDAKNAQVDNRCHFVNEFVPDERVANYFSASDCLALTYSGGFHSASGVLNSNAQFRLPVIASGHGGALHDAVIGYSLGIWVEPDSRAAIVDGLERIRSEPNPARWDEFVQDHSWEQNVAIIGECAGFGPS